jgi:gamma-glutamyltranspeptidase/glutathione hydrolase
MAPWVTVRAVNGMVCAPDHLAASAGLSMLRAGGSAADAAVAASAMLAVTFQHACGMGGDLFAMVHDGTAVSSLNASGHAGSGADPDRLRSSGVTEMPLRDDIAAVPVPGCVDGWLALHERHGRLDLAEVFEPARRAAADGFPASPSLADSVGNVLHLPGAADYTAAGPIRPGTVIRRPGVARTLAAIAAGGRSAFYEGEFGTGLLALGDGEFSPDDLARSQADWVSPLAIDAFGRRLWTVPPNSQGYLTLASSWIADGLDIPADPADPRWAHLLIEATRQAAFDRTAVLSDRADGQALLDPTRLGPRRHAIDPNRAAGLGGDVRGGGTIFLCAVDGDRSGVSLIQSNASGWGSHLVEPATRIFLQDRGIGFSLTPGHPAEYGPRRRPPHTLSPALVTTTSGELDAVIGSMGGDSQPQVLLQLLARLLVAGEEPGPAIAAGRWSLASTGAGSAFDTWRDAGIVRVLLEGHAPDSWDAGLAIRGHEVERRPPYDSGFGWAQAITVDGGSLAGATDPRPRSGGAAAW